MTGFISLHRKLKDNPIWADPNYLKLWIYCLFEASHKEHEQLVGNQMVTLERGQFVTGRFSLEEDMNRGVKPKQKLDKLTWWRYLTNLEKFGMLNIRSTNKYSVVTIVNYDTYQNVFNKGEQQTEQETNNKRTPNEQQVNTNNNGNNGNNKYSAEFEEFWKCYPRKVDKPRAFKSFKTKRKKHSFETIVEGTKRYAAYLKKHQTESQFIKHGSTFLNNDSFLDEYEEAKQVSNKPKKTPEQIEHEKMIAEMRKGMNT